MALKWNILSPTYFPFRACKDIFHAKSNPDMPISGDHTVGNFATIRLDNYRSTVKYNQYYQGQPDVDVLEHGIAWRKISIDEEILLIWVFAYSSTTPSLLFRQMVISRPPD